MERWITTEYLGDDLETRTLFVGPSTRNDGTAVYLTGYAPGGQQFFAYLALEAAGNLTDAILKACAESVPNSGKQIESAYGSVEEKQS